MQTESFSIIGANGTWTRNGLVRVIRYEEGAATGGVRPTIRVRSSSGNAFDVQMNPGKTITLSEPVKGLLLSNISGGSDVSGLLTYGDGTVSDDAIVGTVGLDANTLSALNRPEAHTAGQALTSALTANVAEAYLTPAGNTGGAVFQYFDLVITSTVFTMAGTLLMKQGAAPTSVTDGVPLALLETRASNMNAGSSLQFEHRATLKDDVYVPASYGVYWIQDSGASAGVNRGYRVRVL